MPNRIIYSNEPRNAKVQVYGSDLTTPLEISNGLLMVELPGTPTVVVGNTVSVTGTVQLAGTLLLLEIPFPSLELFKLLDLLLLSLVVKLLLQY